MQGITNVNYVNCNSSLHVLTIFDIHKKLIKLIITQTTKCNLVYAEALVSFSLHSSMLFLSQYLRCISLQVHKNIMLEGVQRRDNFKNYISFIIALNILSSIYNFKNYISFIIALNILFILFLKCMPFIIT